MGAYSDRVQLRIQAKRTMRRIKWPTGYAGMIMWCPKCAQEVMRAEKGSEPSPAVQQAAVTAHELVCGRNRLKAVP